MKPKHQRLAFLSVSMVFLCIAILCTLQAFRSNLVFFYSPSDLRAKPVATGHVLRIGGLVESGSLTNGRDNRVEFRITDGKASLPVRYQGLLPNLFREGQGVVAEGALDTDGSFIATQILAKHDENYMPRDVVDALKRAGRWQGGGRKIEP